MDGGNKREEEVSYVVCEFGFCQPLLSNFIDWTMCFCPPFVNNRLRNCLAFIVSNSLEITSAMKLFDSQSSPSVYLNMHTEMK